MGIHAIGCLETLDTATTILGERTTASSDFSGKDLLGYGALLVAITTVSGCVSSYSVLTPGSSHEGAAVGVTKQEDVAANNGPQHNDTNTAITTAVTTTTTTTTTTTATAAPEQNISAAGNDKLPPHLIPVVDRNIYQFHDLSPQNYDFVDQARSFSKGASPAVATYGWLYPSSGTGKGIFEFQGVDHQGDKDIAHFDVYFLSYSIPGGKPAEHKNIEQLIEQKHIELEMYPFPVPTNEIEAKTQLAPYMKIIGSKEDMTDGPIAVLNFRRNEQYDFQLVARVPSMADGYPDNPKGADSAVLQAVTYRLAKN